MDFFKINDNDFNELVFDINEMKTAFETDNTYTNCLKAEHSKGSYEMDSVKKGNVFFTKSRCEFQQNTVIKSTKGLKNISLYFVKNGEGLSINEKTKKEQNVLGNTNNVFFMQEDLNELSVLKKSVLLETTSLNLSIEYFENLANLYPDLFGKSFRRFEAGESFFINKDFRRTTAEMNHILAQLENADLIGSCVAPYIDAKVLELLCMQFQDTLIIPTTEIIKDEDKIREASFILISDIHNPPSIPELALKVGINEKKMKQGFKSVFGTTVYGYLFEHKMFIARQLLLDTQESVSEIALQCGYEYSSHFCTAFKRKFGITPLEIRK